MKRTTFVIPLAVAVAALAMLFAATRPAQAGPAPEKVAYLGVTAAGVDDTLRDQLKLSRGVGLRIEDVVANSPAAKAGVKTHDILEKLNDQLLFNSPQLAGLVRSFSPGDKVSLALIRQGTRQTLEVTLGETELKEAGKSLIGGWEGLSWTPRVETLFGDDFEKALGQYHGAKARGKPMTFLGVELASVQAAVATQLGLEGETGALVNLVVEDSPAAKAGLKQHDVIVKLDGKAVKDPADLSTRIREHQKGDKITLGILRAGKSIELEATLSEKASDDPSRLRQILEEYRVVPRVRVLQGSPDHREVVVHLESDAEGDGPRVERRVVVRAAEPGKAGEVRLDPPPGRKDSRTAIEHRVIVIKADQGTTTTVKDENGERSVTVKDAQDKVIFDGPVKSETDRQKLPREVRECLEKLEEKVGPELDAEGKDVIRELRFAPASSTPDVI